MYAQGQDVWLLFLHCRTIIQLLQYDILYSMLPPGKQKCGIELLAVTFLTNKSCCYTSSGYILSCSVMSDKFVFFDRVVLVRLVLLVHLAQE